MKRTETKKYVIVAIKPKIMYKKILKQPTSIDINTSVEGETIEQQITRLINNGGEIENAKIPIYTKPSDGVIYGTDIRADKWDKAIETNERINAGIDRIRELKKLHNEQKGDDGEEAKGGENNEAKESI